ncbi:unnamed protein product [Rotaria socialis]|uniref:MSP domain-containing protein n=2 Tax=Rotaria socialis TaxID=392032 RepID=A0A818DZ76_9BILA|nr:unnamed protein product [Rotaria socialis]
MSLPTHLTSNASQLPFFCSSNSLLFYLDDPSTFSQVLTLYNPYDFVVRYKVLCTAPKKYSVAEPQGEIRAQHSVDTIVRLLDTSASSANQNVVHKIRVQFFDRRKSQDLIGKRDVTCSILSYKPLEQSFDDEPNTAGGTSRRTRPNTITNPTPPIIQQETRDPLVVFILTILGAICAFVLVLPTIPDSDNSFNARIPSYLHMTTNSKVIASYILGLLTVQHFSQLLYVLDGRFSQLHTLIVDLINNVLSTDLIENKEKILNLKCFVLSCAWEVTRYEECLLPLIYRMSNIEKLGLYLTIYVNDKFIDGNDLKKNVINRLPQLNLFTFDIRSLMFINNQINLPSKKDIEESFRDFQYTKIISYVDYFREKKTGQCHIFSYPSEMPYYQKITNNFPDGLYRYVRFISLYDEYPFEHEFFIKISQSIPFMERLSLINHQSQIHKQSYKLINHNFNSTIAKYNYLITLDIEEVHDDYIEEFLFNTKTYFHNNIVISINYKSLERVTRNFTRDVTRINCAKINEIFLSGEKRYFNSLRDYFPCARIH